MMSQRDDEPMSDGASEREDEKMAPSSPKSAPKEKTKPKRSPRKDLAEKPKRRNSFTFHGVAATAFAATASRVAATSTRGLWAILGRARRPAIAFSLRRSKAIIFGRRAHW